MHQLHFTGLGTHWSILVDQSVLPPRLETTLKDTIADFESRYSRFIPTSELARIHRATYPVKVSTHLARMLETALTLSNLTHFNFDINLADVLEAYGYDSDYSFRPKSLPARRPVTYSLDGHLLNASGPLSLDLGSIGKGYLIDLLAQKLRQLGLPFFLIDGGGDLYATTKKDSSPWTAAVEHPTDPSLAIVELPLTNMALATSSSQKRRYKNFHHLLNAQTKTPQNTYLSISILAPSALVADSLATAIFVSPPSYIPALTKNFPIEYLLVAPDLSFTTSPHFPSPFSS